MNKRASVPGSTACIGVNMGSLMEFINTPSPRDVLRPDQPRQSVRQLGFPKGSVKKDSPSFNNGILAFRRQESYSDMDSKNAFVDILKRKKEEGGGEGYQASPSPTPIKRETSLHMPPTLQYKHRRKSSRIVQMKSGKARVCLEEVDDSSPSPAEEQSLLPSVSDTTRISVCDISKQKLPTSNGFTKKVDRTLRYTPKNNLLQSRETVSCSQFDTTDPFIGQSSDYKRFVSVLQFGPLSSWSGSNTTPRADEELLFLSTQRTVRCECSRAAALEKERRFDLIMSHNEEDTAPRSSRRRYSTKLRFSKGPSFPNQGPTWK